MAWYLNKNSLLLMTVCCVFVNVLRFQMILLCRILPKFFSQKTKRDHFFCLVFFYLLFCFVSLFLLRSDLVYCVLFADFVALEKLPVRSHSLPFLLGVSVCEKTRLKLKN